MAKASKPDLDDVTVQIARRMLTMPPKPHEEMKVVKPKRESAPSPKKRKAVKKRLGS